MASNGPSAERSFYGSSDVLGHRLRHIFAVVRSLVARSSEFAGAEVRDYAAHLDGRIAAFARIQTGLMLYQPAALDLEHILAEELLTQSVNDAQYTLSGPTIVVPERVGEVLTLAFHELATNAAKFGALASPDGMLTISWRVLDGPVPAVQLVWAETGIACETPVEERFGLELVTRQAPYEIGGVVEIEFSANAMRCEMTIPISRQNEVGND